jgi:hypothetical protein
LPEGPRSRGVRSIRTRCALVLLFGGDLDRVFQSLLEGLDLGLPPGELLPEFVDAGLGRGAVHGVGDPFGLALQRLP